MKNKYLALTAATIVFFFLGTQSIRAHTAEPKITGLMNMPLSDIDGKDSNVVLFEVGPGWKIANHYHPGHIFIYVLEGAINLDVNGKKSQLVTAGNVAYEAPGQNMVANNVSSSEGAKFLVFTVGDIGKPVTVFVE